METKGIDLTKCNNLRYKAKVDGNDDYGRICVENADTGLAFLRSDREDGYIATWHCDEPGIDGCCGRKVMDFEIVPRDPDTYQDWQVGDIVLDSCEDSDWRVIFRSGEFVVVADNCPEDKLDIIGCYTCSQLFREGWRLILTDIERQIIEEKKRYEPQDGDICYAISVTGYNDVFICKTGDRKTEYYASTASDSGGAVTADENIEVLRPATEEEKQQLFDTMAKRGKRWNAEKKVVEDIPKPYEFRKGEPVLVRGYEFHRWIIAAYVDKDKLGFIANAGVSVIHWKYCLPYNESTMHLLGTTEDYREE